MITLSIVIPCYNEEKRIAKTLQSLIDKKHNIPFKINELIIVDDGSSDNTLNVIESFNSQFNLKIIKQKNIGPGYAITQGLRKASSDFVVYADADESTDWNSLINFYNYIDSDVIIGKRELTNTNKPLIRKIASLFFKYLGRIYLGINQDDLYCGFKMFKVKTTQKILNNLSITDFAISPEILYLANRYNKKVSSVPVKWVHNFDSKVNWMSGIKCLKSNLLIPFNSYD